MLQFDKTASRPWNNNSPKAKYLIPMIPTPLNIVRHHFNQQKKIINQYLSVVLVLRSFLHFSFNFPLFPVSSRHSHTTTSKVQLISSVTLRSVISLFLQTCFTVFVSKFKGTCFHCRNRVERRGVKVRGTMGFVWMSESNRCQHQ